MAMAWAGREAPARRNIQRGASQGMRYLLSRQRTVKNKGQQWSATGTTVTDAENGSALITGLSSVKSALRFPSGAQKRG